MELFCSSTDTELALWWDPAENAPADAVYDIYLNDRPVQRTCRTHCTLEGLRPRTAYVIYVRICGEHFVNGEFTTQNTPRRLNVKEFGAKGDGRTMDTAALQSAIDRCGPEEEVYLPAGIFLTGALDLHGGMSLYLEEGAVLQGTEDPADYLPKVWSRFEGIEQECFRSLLNLGTLDRTAGPTTRGVQIRGRGTVSGGGQKLALNIIAAEKERLKEEIAALGDRINEYENDDTLPGRARGRLISLCNCEDVRISGLTLQNGASWNVHMVYSRGIVTDHCVFRSEGVWNGDGWDPDSSEDCTLFACEFHTGDDSVAIKSGKNPEGCAIARPTRNIRIFDCRSEYGLGVAIGSEMSGGVENVKIWDCDLAHSLYGIQIKGTKKRGGYVRNISVQDCVLSRFLCCAVTYNDDGVGSPVPPVFSDMVCRRVHLTGWAREYWESEMHAVPAIDLSGFDVPGYEVKNISFIGCTLGREASVALKHFRQVRLDVSQEE